MELAGLGNTKILISWAHKSSREVDIGKQAETIAETIANNISTTRIHVKITHNIEMQSFRSIVRSFPQPFPNPCMVGARQRRPTKPVSQN
jgi:hypothetical protein